MSQRPVDIAPLTRWDYQELPDGGPRYELLEGELVMAPSPNRRHQTISKNIAFLFETYLRQHPLGEVYNAPLDVYLSETTVVQPDVFFVSQERPSRLRDYGIEGAPDLVIEILSPHNPRQDAVVKKSLYARSGVIEYWIVDPESARVLVFSLQQDPNQPRHTLAPGDLYTSPLLPGLAFPVQEFFR